MSEIAIRIEQVSKTYHKRNQRTEAVKNVSLDIPKGAIVSLLGANGSGKTTLIKMMCGLCYPDQGDIWIEQYSVKRELKKALYSMGVILEGERNIYYYLTVYDNLFYFGTLNQIPKKKLVNKIDDLLVTLGLDMKRNSYAGELSRGMQQKLALAITLLKEPDILLLDEPTLGLDVQASHDLLEMIEGMARAGKTIVLTTHQLELAERVSDHIILLQAGEVLTYQSKDELLRKYNGQLIVEITVYPNDAEKMNKMEGVYQVEENVFTMPLKVFEAIMINIQKQRIQIVDLKKREISLEDIFLELVGENK